MYCVNKSTVLHSCDENKSGAETAHPNEQGELPMKSKGGTLVCNAVYTARQRGCESRGRGQCVHISGQPWVGRTLVVEVRH